MGPRESGVPPRVLQLPHGIVLVTARRQRKTSTLYNDFAPMINDSERKINHDRGTRIEYQLKGVNRSRFNENPADVCARIAVDPAATTGRDSDRRKFAIMRRRRVAVQASLTGHLVFSTLHTNDAAGAVTRLG